MNQLSNDYQFFADVTCDGNPRIEVIVQFLALLQNAFELERWASSSPTPATCDYVAQKIEVSRKRVRRHPDSNAAMSFVTASPSAEVRVIINTGSRAVTSTDADGFNVLFNGDLRKPNSQYWLQAVQLLKPFQASLANCQNKNIVQVQERLHRNFPQRPAACLGLDYYGARIVENLGGKAHVLKTPAHSAREFLDGVLIELVPGYYLDRGNPEHLKIQAAAMRHLGIDD